mmetsp:Transcript_6711/g.7481  ORF Transcript_6711/g.7481 Transcript_6711/m.7481 type:complete len:95 (-) Transcript_6711:3-287(-)
MATLAALRECFTKMDTSRKGKISKSDLKDFFAKGGRSVPEATLEDAITFADSDNDGQLDLDDFLKVVLAFPRSMGERRHMATGTAQVFDEEMKE